jgi:hypothetical protein
MGHRAVVADPALPETRPAGFISVALVGLGLVYDVAVLRVVGGHYIRHSRYGAAATTPSL